MASVSWELASEGLRGLSYSWRFKSTKLEQPLLMQLCWRTKIQVPEKVWYPVINVDECQVFWKRQFTAVFSVAGNITDDSTQKFIS